MVAAYHGPVTDTTHDPGSDRSSARVKDLPPDVAAEPIHLGPGAADTGVVRIGTASWTDPTMTAGGRLLPRGRRHGRGAARLLRQQVPARRGRLDLLRPPRPADRRAVGRAHAAGLHVRHQGARADDRPADRDQAPAEGPPRGPARRASPTKPRIYAKDLPDALRDDVWAWFADALEPLKEAGQLGSILLQYPRWFFTSSENRDQIEEAIGRLREAGMTGAVEFRSASWFNEKNIERTLAFLGDREIPMVIVDEPQGFKSSVPAVVAATSPDLAIVRFHGRRTETWEAKGIQTVERFRYLYDRDELAGVGAARPGDGRPGEGHARPVQQLLRELRRDERARARAAAPRPRGRRRLVAPRSRRRGGPPRGAWPGRPMRLCTSAT